MDEFEVKEYGYQARQFTNGHVDWLVLGVAGYGFLRFISLPDVSLKQVDWLLLMSAVFWCALASFSISYFAFPLVRRVLQRFTKPRITLDRNALTVPVGLSMRRRITIPFGDIQALYFDPISQRLRITSNKGAFTLLKENFDQEDRITELREILYLKTSSDPEQKKSFDYLINPTQFALLAFPLQLIFDLFVIARILDVSVPIPIVTLLNHQPWIPTFLMVIGWITCTWAAVTAMRILVQYRNQPQLALSDGELTAPPGWFGWKPKVIVLSNLTEAYVEDVIVLMKSKTPQIIDARRFSTPEHFSAFSKALRKELEALMITLTPSRLA